MRVLNVDIAPPEGFRARSPTGRSGHTGRRCPPSRLRFLPPQTWLHSPGPAKTVLDERTTLDFYAANIQGVQNVIDAIQAAGSVERTFFASSRLVCRLGDVRRSDTDYQPSTLYGLSKVRGEQLVRAAPPGLGTWTILRPTGSGAPGSGCPIATSS